MAGIGDYTPQQMRNLIMKIYPGTYTPSAFNNVVLNWSSKVTYSSTKDVKAAITGLVDIYAGDYTDEAYTYLKYCEEYIVGYSQYGVQILRGKCYYGGIRDLNAYIGIWVKPIYHETKDLGGIINSIFRIDFPAAITGRLPVDLAAYVDVTSRSYSDLTAFIRGLEEAFLPAYINTVWKVDLSAYLDPIPPADLPAYLKVWPMEHLPASIYGWDKLDLSASTYAIQKGDLPAIIATVPPKNLRVILRAWAREVPADLGAYIDGFTYSDLPTIIRATYLKDLSAYMAVVAPANLQAMIMGYDLLNLNAILNGVYGAYDLRAHLTPTNNFKNLIGIIKQVTATEVEKNLPAYIKGVGSGILYAYINPAPYVNLAGYINAQGGIADLSARIIPKTIRLTSVLSVITMEHMDLSAVINPSCIWSEPRDLAAYISVIYKSDLPATLIGRKYPQQMANLSARINFADTYSFIDKLPISVTITTDYYRYIDLLPLFIKVFTEHEDLTASITGTYMYNDLTAAITGSYIAPHHFDNVRNKQKVSKLNHAGMVEWYEMVELSFKSIVEDYFYSSYGGAAWKVDRLDKWVLNVSSYIPQNLKLNTKRRLHRLKYLYDLRRFRSVDEAVRYAIDFVTDYPEVNLPARLNPSGGFRNIQGILNPKRIVRESNNLTSYIVGTEHGTKVLGFTDGTVDVD